MKVKYEFGICLMAITVVAIALLVVEFIGMAAVCAYMGVELVVDADIFGWLVLSDYIVAGLYVLYIKVKDKLWYI